ncbi:MAG: hypothetical protein ACTS73_02465 [Arsenophonus sp. NEOnobi-MAG3]
MIPCMNSSVNGIRKLIVTHVKDELEAMQQQYAEHRLVDWHNMPRRP